MLETLMVLAVLSNFGNVCEKRIGETQKNQPYPYVIAPHVGIHSTFAVDTVISASQMPQSDSSMTLTAALLTTGRARILVTLCYHLGASSLLQKYSTIESWRKQRAQPER